MYFVLENMKSMLLFIFPVNCIMHTGQRVVT